MTRLIWLTLFASATALGLATSHYSEPKVSPHSWFDYNPPQRILVDSGSHLATWYSKGLCKDGSKFTGKGFTCASTVFSRGARLMLETGSKSCVVRVNDYGPQRPGWTLDCSGRVAEHLGFKRKGWARINVYRLENYRQCR